MGETLLPTGWEHHAAPIANLFTPLGDPLLWWLAAVLCLLAALALATRRPTPAIALAIVGALALAIAADGLVDDAYIQFRYAANLASGHGPVFNPGQRIEGASGGLWIAILAGTARLIHTDPGLAARVLSLLLAPFSVLLIAAAARRRIGHDGAAPLAVAWAALPTLALYAATGLETTAFACALWLLVWGIVVENSPAAGIAGALIAAVRPEGLVLAVAVLPFWRRLQRTARIAAVSATATALTLAVLRLLYYGSPFPNSVLVKSAAAAGLAYGLAYLGAALLEWWPLLASTVVLARRWRPFLPALLPALGWTVLVTLRGGDWMPASRYFLPLLVVLVGALALLSPRSRTIVAGLLLAWSAVRLYPSPTPDALAGDLWRAMAAHRVQSRWWEALGNRLEHELPPGTTLAAGPAGALPYASGLRTFDLYGLNTPVAVRREGPSGHTLWGLRGAVTAGVDVLYPGGEIPQVNDGAGVLQAARRLVADVPAVEERYRPIILTHRAEYPLDVVCDVLWVRIDRSEPVTGRTPHP